MINSPKELAMQLKLYRVKNNLTQYELASKIGIKQSTISSFENHPEKTQLMTVFKIIQSLELGMVLSPKSEIEVLNKKLL